MNKLEKLLAAPKTHEVVTVYECGKKSRHQTRCLKSAENWATGQRHKIGLELIDRETGKTVKAVAVEINRV